MNVSLHNYEAQALTPSKQIPLVNFHVFGLRPEPVVPDGVWIEIKGTASANEAVFNAINEEKRILASLHHKNERLKQFQKNVQRRVTNAAQAHKRFIADSQSVKMEKERELLCRSASAAELSTPKKNRCSYNVNPISIIDGTGKLRSASLNLSSQDQGDPMLHICDDVTDKYVVNDVRKKLAGRTIVPKTSDSLEENEVSPAKLPGGLWGVGASRDKCAARIYDKDDHGKSKDGYSSSDNDVSLETVSATSADDDVTLASLQESISSSLALSQKRLNDINKCCRLTNVTSSETLPSVPECEPVCVKSSVHFQIPDHLAEGENQPVLVTAEPVDGCRSSELVTSSLPNNARRSDPRRKETSLSRMPRRSHQSTSTADELDQYFRQATLTGAPPLVNPGAFAHNLKLADERAKWLSRRVFADAERERSREHARWKEHQQRVARLREEKENERAEIEEKSREQVEAVERVNAQMKMEVEKREKREKIKQEKMVKKQQKTDRFVAALYSQIRERIAQHKIELPPLCMCGNTFWDTNPKTCATNCIFHRNPKAYAKALEAVLKAVERNLAPIYKEPLQRTTVSLGLVDEEIDESGATSARTACTSARSTDLSYSSDIINRLSTLSAESL